MYHNFATSEECDHIVALAKPQVLIQSILSYINFYLNTQQEIICTVDEAKYSCWEGGRRHRRQYQDQLRNFSQVSLMSSSQPVNVFYQLHEPKHYCFMPLILPTAVLCEQETPRSNHQQSRGQTSSLDSLECQSSGRHADIAVWHWPKVRRTL